MRVTIRQKNLKITPALGVYIEQKLLKPTRRSLGSILSEELLILDLEFYRRTRHHQKGVVYHAEANLNLGGKMIRARTDDENIRAAVDLLEEKLEKGITTFKGRAQALYKRRARTVKKERYDRAARFYRRGRILEEGL